MKEAKHSILLVEDSHQFVLLLQIMLEGIPFKKVQIASSYDEALALLENSTPDLFLLDIELSHDPLKSGIALGEAIREKEIDAPIIYITSHYTEDYYEQTKHTRPSNFLSKELSRLTLRQAIDLALLNYEAQEHSAPHSLEHTNPIPPKIAPDHFFFKIGDAYKSIPLAKIAYFFADKKMSYARMEGRSYPTSIQLKVLEEELQYLGFFRVHKTYLANIKHIESIHPRDSALTVAGESLPIGNTYRKGFLEMLNLLK